MAAELLVLLAEGLLGPEFMLLLLLVLLPILLIPLTMEILEFGAEGYVIEGFEFKNIRRSLGVGLGGELLRLRLEFEFGPRLGLYVEVRMLALLLLIDPRA